MRLCTLYFDCQVSHSAITEQMINFFNYDSQLLPSSNLTICCTKDTVVCSNYFGFVIVFMINDCKEQGYFQDFSGSLDSN